MRKVRCHECGKVYNFDAEDFCPRCGAFTQPPKSTAIDADGSVIRVEGINEENRERRRTGLSKGTRRTGQTARSARTQEQNRPAALKWLVWVIAGIMVLNVLGGLMDAFLYW